MVLCWGASQPGGELLSWDCWPGGWHGIGTLQLPFLWAESEEDTLRPAFRAETNLEGDS